MNSPEHDHPNIIAYPPLIFAVCVGLGLGFHWLLPMPLSPPLPLRIFGLVLLIISASVSLTASATMRKAGTNIRPDRPSTTVVSTGPFRFTRNPLYLSLCLLNTGIALLVCDLIPLLMTAVLIGVLHFGVILREEKYLAAKFGQAYADYCHQVRRWL
jgi:protein-S-isoprenylcysteine O-methyltransferase Ste14